MQPNQIAASIFQNIYNNIVKGFIDVALFIIFDLFIANWYIIIILALAIIAAKFTRNRISDKMEPLERVDDYKKQPIIYTPNEVEEQRLVGIIKIKDPDFDKEIFEKFSEEIFRKFIVAYNENKLDSLRKYVDINIIEKYKIKITQKNVIEQTEIFDIVNCNYVDFFGYHVEGPNEIISVAIGAVLYNYTKDREGNIIGGSNSKTQLKTFLLSFARKAGGKTIKNIKNYDDGIAHCLNCGAEITSVYSECEHCGSIIFNSTENWLLNHIEVI